MKWYFLLRINKDMPWGGSEINWLISMNDRNLAIFMPVNDYPVYLSYKINNVLLELHYILIVLIQVD